MGVNFKCENCGWSEIIGSSIMCNYSGHRTLRDECCEAWKPKGEDTNMVEVVRCKDCKHYDSETQSCNDGLDGIFLPDWFCADGERR